MKKVLPLVLALSLVFGNVAYAATMPVQATKVTMAMKSGIVLKYTENSVTVKENKKEVTYRIDMNTHVVSSEAEVVFAEAVKKGLTISYKAKGYTLTHVDIPVAGMQTQGAININPNISETGYLVNLNLNIVDTRNNVSDTNIIPTNNATTKYTAVVTGEETDDAFVVKDTKTLDIGDMDIVKGSMTVTDGTVTYKVLEEGEFDATKDNDEVKIMAKGTFKSLVFEKDLTDAQKAGLKISFKKVIRTITGVETTTYPLSANVVIELNGKSTPSLAEGAYAIVSTDAAGNVVYIDSFYNNATGKFLGAVGTKAVIGIIVEGKHVKTEMIDVNTEAAVSDANGDPIDLHKIKAGVMVQFTVDPDNHYEITELSVQK